MVIAVEQKRKAKNLLYYIQIDMFVYAIGFCRIISMKDKSTVARPEKFGACQTGVHADKPVLC